ncbi:histidinol-phosphate transaminase [Sulfurospirillum sp. T05]|uniref:Histidinol-phosphate aminotransferase n=1 Tax=Sulfurospirillum tamanense TaxID=2813362 RepID=A0ABS2WP10_9BACT|nr:histidinol-phosphate transaminase [Sulfurospirillum tamanensis]MBN2963421.1 histidinol-phosphate transaminase [Sulfurospirillum tamanensis]
MTFNPVLDGLKNYEAGKPIELVVRDYGIAPQDVIKLASNENPRGCSLGVLAAMQQESTRAHLYPDDSMYELKDGLASRFGVKKENVIIGAGSDQVIGFALHAKANPNQAILMAGVTFAMYEIYGKQTGATILKTPSKMHNLEDFKQMLATHKGAIGVLFLCLPNNPLGEALDADEVKLFLREVDPNILVVVDGAYQEYASYKDQTKALDPRALIEEFPNVLYLGTFSKAYGLGGMRCGYGIGEAGLIHTLHKLRPPFNITTLSLKAGIEALKDEGFVARCMEENFSEMKRYEAEARALGFDFIESYTNFITLEFPEGKIASKIAQSLLEKGIIIRDLSAYGMNAVRVTIGTPEQNSRFFENFKRVYC